ncbi:hypothetical protein U5A82_13445 [Sphingobium sp. CR2-8]|uniref:hypothetical protein n=1 Tax=Sphingobium sp. CR2-8 TaxID=1306534 RepID=UPI002DBA2271|nr:hypothetical protein [Sphingobium sp. CR2-8]MEC3911429.1 hypothetical protein [Sphingobium sp. CR2-8]
MTFAPALSRRLSGRIAYRVADGSETGHEHFDLSSHPGGHILRALCVLDDAALLRDVSLSMGADWRPRDGYCRLTRDGREEAALWFDVGVDAVRVEGRVAGAALPSHRIATDGPLVYLGLHPLQGDALIVQARGIDRPGTFVPIDAITNSISPNGDEAVGACPVRIDVAYIGQTDIHVTAGTFAARHYQLRWRDDWPPADLWVRQQDCLFLAMRWSHVPTTYELTDFAEEPLP